MLDFTASSGADVCDIQFFFSCEYICNHHYETLTFTDRVTPIDLLLKFELQKAFGNYKGAVEWFCGGAKKANPSSL